MKGRPARHATARAARRACVLAAASVPLLAALQACAETSPAHRAAHSAGHSTAQATQRTPAMAGELQSSAPAPGRTVAPHQNPFGSAAASYVTVRSGTIAAAVYDVRTGQTWSLGQQQPQAEASIVKLDILEALYAQHSASRHSASQDGASQDGASQDGASPAGLSGTDRRLAQQMMEDSDNTAATSLWYAAGGPGRIGSFNTAAGLTHTSPSSCVQCPGFAWPGWGLSTTTPTDQLALLRTLIKPSALLTDAERSSVLELMENVAPSQRWGVTGGVPAQATVALKDGWLPLNSAATDWQVNSIGWISGGGRDYLMAVLSTGNPTEQYGISTINQLSALVWADMS